MNLSDEQSEIIQASQQLREGEILKIDACAGSGKTSTLVEIVKANPDKEFLYLAFNRNIADDTQPGLQAFVPSSEAFSGEY